MTTTLEAEAAVVGAVLAGYPDVTGLVGIVEAADFESVHLEKIWRAIVSLATEGLQPEPMRVRDRMGRDVMSLPDGPLYLQELMSAAHSVASAPYYAEIVSAAARRRRVQAAALRISQMTQDPGFAEDIEGLAEAARSEMDAATSVRSSRDLRRFGDYLPAVYDVAEKGRPNGLSTPWPGLDRIINGLQPGRLIVIGARPGIGKSIMCVDLARWTAHHHGQGVMFASLEMPGEEVTQRLVANHAGVPIKGLMEGSMSAAGWEKTHDGHVAMAAMPIYIEDSAEQSLASIRSKVAEVRREHGDLGLIVVDYLQLMRTRDASRQRAEQVGELSRGLKILAREANVCVVAAAQVNRGSVSRIGGRPSLSDLRESGSIEADADVVILMHRELYEDSTMSTSAEVIVAKNRSGPVTATTLEVQGHYSRLIEPNTWTQYVGHTA